MDTHITKDGNLELTPVNDPEAALLVLFKKLYDAGDADIIFNLDEGVNGE